MSISGHFSSSKWQQVISSGTHLVMQTSYGAFHCQPWEFTWTAVPFCQHTCLESFMLLLTLRDISQKQSYFSRSVWNFWDILVLAWSIRSWYLVVCFCCPDALNMCKNNCFKQFELMKPLCWNYFPFVAHFFQYLCVLYCNIICLCSKMHVLQSPLRLQQFDLK